MKRAFIIHGWDGYPGECWFPWLKSELERRGIVVTVPQIPESSTPAIEAWVSRIGELVGTPNRETYFVGHSIGVQAILRYLETVKTPVGGVVCVSGWFTLVPGSIGTADDEKIAAPWVNTPIDAGLVKKNARKIAAIFSDDDRYVPLENAEMFRERLGASTLILHAKGHIGGSDNAKEVPEILEAVLRVIEN